MNVRQNLILVFIAILASSAIWMANQSFDNPTAKLPQESRLLQGTNKFLTNPDRTKGVIAACAGKDRNKMLVSEVKATSDEYKAQVSALFKLDSNKLFTGLINNKTNESLELITGNISPWIQFIVPFIVGLILILVIWPFLCCCCCCTGCCPSKCCQKKDEDAYTKCELIWPTVVLIIALLLACVSSIVGLTKANALAEGTGNFVCATFILFDDFLNGNVTQDQLSFFVGVNTLDKQLTTFNTSIDAIGTQLDKLKTGGTFMNDVKVNMDLAIDEVSKIPDNTVGGELVLSYDSPISATGPGGSTTSTFKAQLGKSTVAASLVGSNVQVLKALSDSLGTIASNAGTFSTSIAGFKTSVDGVKSTISGFSKTLNDLDTQIYGFYDIIKAALQGVTLGTTVFFAVVIGLTVLALIGLILMAFCDKFKCRYLIYFACVILFLIGIIGFLITVVFSLLTPTIFFGCEFLNFALSSPSNFQANFGGLVDAQTSGYITTCLSTGNGKIIDVIAPGIASTFNSATSTINDVTSFTGTEQNSKLTTAWNLLGTRITQVLDTVTVDLPPGADLDTLKNIASRTGFTCSDTKFAGDSWVPSTNALQTTVPCSISGGASVTTCGTFTTAACVGCMDTTKLFSANTTSAHAKTALDGRYTSGDCTAASGFNEVLSNVWLNYYIEKKTAITAVKGRYDTPNTAVTGSVTKAFQDITTDIPAKFKQIKDQLAATASSITDPKYGLIAGMNCKIVGENMNRIISVFCNDAFVAIYFMRLVLGIASFGILFAMCCAVCAGVRHYKHSEYLNRVPSQGGNTMNFNEPTNAQFNTKY